MLVHIFFGQTHTGRQLHIGMFDNFTVFVFEYDVEMQQYACLLLFGGKLFIKSIYNQRIPGACIAH